MPWFWFGLGGFIGLVNGATQIRIVSQIHPEADFNVRTRVFWSYGLRFGLDLLGLLWAVNSGITPALGMFGGLWLTRWIPVLVAYNEVIDWTQFEVS
jgi:hypothetical protein